MDATIAANDLALAVPVVLAYLRDTSIAEMPRAGGRGV